MTAADVINGAARWCVVEGDAVEVLPLMPAGFARAVVTDPPSGIAFMGAEWDRDKGGRAQWIAWLARILAAARVACADGSRAAVWALPRTSHWTGCAVEDAGWSIETKGYHIFGTGWPKGKSQLQPAAEEWIFARTGRSTPLNIDACRVGTSKSTPASPSQSPWHGRMAPSSLDEDAFNPTIGRYPPNVTLGHADGCVLAGVRRVAATSIHGESTATRNAGGAWSGAGGALREGRVMPVRGYADPDGAETVDAWECVEGCAVQTLDAQAGERTSGVKVGGGYKHDGAFAEGRGGGLSGDGTTCYGDTGSAARFFPQFEHEAPFLYCAKPSGAEKRAGLDDDHARHPTVKPVALMRWLIRLTTQPGDIVLDPFAGSGTTGVAALAEGRRFIGVERDPAFAAIARARMEHAAPSPERLRTMTSTPVRVDAPDFGPLFGGAR